MRHYDRGNLPAPVQAMRRYRKKVPTPMIHVEGPFTVTTAEGLYSLPEGWSGFIAVDTAGHPYPVVDSVHRDSYELEPG